jgi:hypothetical protein
MAAIIELKYFNAFALKKIKNIVDVKPGTVADITGGSNPLDVSADRPAPSESGEIDLLNSGAGPYQIDSITIEELENWLPLTVKINGVDYPETNGTGDIMWYVSGDELTFSTSIPADGDDWTLTTTPPQGLYESQMNVGQEVSFAYLDGIDNSIIRYYKGHITERLSDQQIRISPNPINFDNTPVPPIPAFEDVKITFGKISDFQFIPGAYREDGVEDREESWLLEESRIRGGYNNATVDFGVRAYVVEDEPKQSHKFSGLIHSGPFNSRTGFNATNQFSVAEDITRTIDPSNGSIQRLYAEDTNLIIFQESKVSKSLIDKDAIYTAEGNPQVTATNKVIGQNVSFGGEFGISKDPESFAVNGYRKYFTDRDQNIVCRLSRDGITPISSAGMTDFFRDNLPAASSIKGGWDAHNKQYVLSLGSNGQRAASFDTLAYDEASKGWVSRYSYDPNWIFSVNNNYYTAYNGKLWKHYTLNPGSDNRGVFYGTQYPSTISVVFNGAPSTVKNMQAVNYEGDSGWSMFSFTTNTDTALSISPAVTAVTLEQMENQMFISSFKAKEDKYYGTLINSSLILGGEVVFGRSSSGVKGFYGEITMKLDNAGKGSKEIFAISTTFVRSS